MAHEQPGMKLTATASGAISQYTFVQVVTGASQDQLTVSAASSGDTNRVIGVAQATAADGDAVEIMYSGISKVSASGAIARGAAVTIDTGAKAKAAIYAAGETKSVGLATSPTTAAGQLASVLIKTPGFGS